MESSAPKVIIRSQFSMFCTSKQTNPNEDVNGIKKKVEVRQFVFPLTKKLVVTLDKISTWSLRSMKVKSTTCTVTEIFDALLGV